MYFAKSSLPPPVELILPNNSLPLINLTSPSIPDDSINVR